MDKPDLKQTEISASPKQLSKKGAWFLGSIFITAGLWIILISLKILPVDPSKVHAPLWIIFCAGLVFTLCGTAVINGYAFSSPNVLISDLAGLSIVGLMLVIDGWVAFGPGERHFTTGKNSSFGAGIPVSSGEGRFFFGIGFVFLLAFFIYGTVNSIKKLMKEK
ncbi:MAG TPA: hypothetical protein VMD52_07760 [Patescibacteria group bacterium]|nr:hypothetical protein [Patescibacteria group bacterium]